MGVAPMTAQRDYAGHTGHNDAMPLEHLHWISLLQMSAANDDRQQGCQWHAVCSNCYWSAWQQACLRPRYCAIWAKEGGIPTMDTDPSVTCRAVGTIGNASTLNPSHGPRQGSMTWGPWKSFMSWTTQMTEWACLQEGLNLPQRDCGGQSMTTVYMRHQPYCSGSGSNHPCIWCIGSQDVMHSHNIDGAPDSGKIVLQDIIDAMWWHCMSNYDMTCMFSFWFGFNMYWWVTLLIYTTIQSKLWQHLHPFLSSLPHHSQTVNISSQSVLPIIIINMSSNSIPLQSISRWPLDSDDYDAHVNIWANYIHSTPSFRHLLDFVPCSLKQLLTIHMPLEMEYFLKVFLNCNYFQEKSRSINMIMGIKINTWQILGLQGNCCYLLNEHIYAVPMMTGPVLKGQDSAEVHIC